MAQRETMQGAAALEGNQGEEDFNPTLPGTVFQCRRCGVEFNDIAAMKGHFKDPQHVQRLLSNDDSDSSDDSDSDSTSGGSEEEVEVFKAEGSKGLESKGVLVEVGMEEGRRKQLYWDIAYLDKQGIPPGTRRNQWLLLLFRSGRFAAAVLDNGKPTVHKTLHKYTVRRKQGGAQSARDGSGKRPKSVGAQIRRANEALLRQQIQEVLKAWAADIGRCSRIFIACAKMNLSQLWGEGLSKEDERIRRIPFPTGRPTFEELKKCYHRLVTPVISAVSESKLEDNSSGQNGADESKETSQGPKNATKAEAPEHRSLDSEGKREVAGGREPEEGHRRSSPTGVEATVTPRCDASSEGKGPRKTKKKSKKGGKQRGQETTKQVPKAQNKGKAKAKQKGNGDASEQSQEDDLAFLEAAIQQNKEAKAKAKQAVEEAKREKELSQRVSALASALGIAVAELMGFIDGNDERLMKAELLLQQGLSQEEVLFVLMSEE